MISCVLYANATGRSRDRKNEIGETDHLAAYYGLFKIISCPPGEIKDAHQH